MVFFRSIVLTFALFLACWTTLPGPASAGHGNKHGGGSNGLDTLLTAGVLASVLQNKGGGGGGGGGGKGHSRSAIPIGGHFEGRSAMPFMPQPMMPYPQPMGYGPPMMPYGQQMQFAQQPMMFDQQSMPYGQQSMLYGQQAMQYGQQPMMPYMSQAQGSSKVSVSDFSALQPTDKVEIIRL